MSDIAVVDAHTHIFTPQVVAGREAYVRRDLWFEHLYADPRALLISGGELLHSMDNAGITQSLVCGFPWHDIGICREHNDYMAEVVRESQGRFAWLATVPPALGDVAAAEARRCLEAGAVGIGELNADAQQFDLREPSSLAAVVAVCTELDRPLMLHATEPVGHVYPGKGTATPDRILSFLHAFPELRVVAAHWGGGLPFYELMPEVATAAARVVYDSAASTYLYRFEVFRAVIDIIGPERVLFGSDYPVLRQDRFLRRVKRAGLSTEEEALVLSQNARRVFGLAAQEGERSD